LLTKTDWKVDYPPSQPVGSGFKPHWRPQPAKLPSFGGYSLETKPNQTLLTKTDAIHSQEMGCQLNCNWSCQFLNSHTYTAIVQWTRVRAREHQSCVQGSESCAQTRFVRHIKGTGASWQCLHCSASKTSS